MSWYAAVAMLVASSVVLVHTTPILWRHIRGGRPTYGATLVDAPSPDLLEEAQREVDAMLPGTPPIAPPKRVPPSLIQVAGNSVWRAPEPPPFRPPVDRFAEVERDFRARYALETRAEVRALVSVAVANAAIADGLNPWWARYAKHINPATNYYVLRPEFSCDEWPNGQPVSGEWLAMHRADLEAGRKVR